jgi:glyoxylase I family protein
VISLAAGTKVFLACRPVDMPTEYPQYNKGNGYYAVFFADTDGLKLEFVYTPD